MLKNIFYVSRRINNFMATETIAQEVRYKGDDKFSFHTKLRSFFFNSTRFTLAFKKGKLTMFGYRYSTLFYIGEDVYEIPFLSENMEDCDLSRELIKKYN